MSAKIYSVADVEDFLHQALAHNELSPIYDVRIENGQLQFKMCVPHKHWLRRDGIEYQVTASDSTVVVATSTYGATIIVHAHNLDQYEIFEKPLQKVTQASMEFDVPPIGGVYTHKSGRTYLVYGHGNLRANAANAERYPITIHYVGANGYTWSKSLEGFLSTMTIGGNFSFNAGVEFEYMGICHNGSLEGGFLTKEIQKLLQSTES